MASINIIQVFLVYFTITTVVQADVLYPFGLAAGDTAASPPEDDQCYGPHNHSIAMYGKQFSEIYVCSNGVISLDNAYKFYTTRPFPLYKGEKASLIAPFWADADLTYGGKLWSRETADPVLLQRASDEVKTAYNSASNSSYKATWMLIATWEDVMPFTRPGKAVPKENTFQAVIISDGTTYFVIYNYGKINWISGSGSGPAQVGLDSGDGVNYYTIPHSRTPSIINVTSDSNVGIPGRMVFQLGSSGIIAPAAITTSTRTSAPTTTTTSTTTSKPTTTTTRTTTSKPTTTTTRTTTSKPTTTTTSTTTSKPTTTTTNTTTDKAATTTDAETTTKRRGSTTSTVTTDAPVYPTSIDPLVETPVLVNFIHIDVKQILFPKRAFPSKSFFEKLAENGQLPFN